MTEGIDPEKGGEERVFLHQHVYLLDEVLDMETRVAHLLGRTVKEFLCHTVLNEYYSHTMIEERDEYHKIWTELVHTVVDEPSDEEGVDLHTPTIIVTVWGYRDARTQAPALPEGKNDPKKE